MPILALVHIPVEYEAASKAFATNAELVGEIMVHAEKHGGKVIGHMIGEGKHVSMDEWPSREAYDAFKRDARDAIVKWNRELGLDGMTDEIWENEEIWDFDPYVPAG